MCTICAATVSRNDAELLRECLASARGADELIVFDMESSDATAAVAKEFGARVVPVAFSPVVEGVRQEIHRAATTEWVLHLDPDERLPAGWLDAVRGHLERDGGRHVAFRVEYLDFAFGKPLRHLSRGVGKISVTRRDGVTWDPSAPAHSGPLFAGEPGSLVGVVPPVHHFSLRSVGGAVDKIKRYAVTGGSSTGRAADDPFLLPKLLFYSVVVRRAYRDGAEGILFVTLADIANYLGLLTHAEENGLRQREVRPSTRRALECLSRLQGLRAKMRAHAR
jgi:glycosyltransferase involved in cell wall biosynthesis